MPSATPGREQALVCSDPVPVACVLSQSISLPIVSFGATYRIQRLTLHLATFLQPRAIIAFGSKYGMDDYSFPGGLRTLLTRSHFQVSG